MKATKRGRGRVGRRIVVSFLLSALVPLLAFAWHSHRQVAEELERRSTEQLRQDVKSAGVTLIERLVLAANELAGRIDGHHGSLDPRAGHVVRSTILEIRDPAGSELVDEDVRAALDRCAVTFRALSGDRFWLIANVDGRAEPVAGLVDTGYLFEPDGMVRSSGSASVHRVDGTLLHSSGAPAPSVGTLEEHNLGSTARAEIRWSEGDDERTGIFWEVFMTPQFGQNLVVTIHHPRARTLAPIRHFERTFLTVVLLTIAAVLLASLVRIRRIMTPITDLVQATERIARQDFTARVGVAGKDEFSTLGQAFNSMAADMQHRAMVMEKINEFGASLSVEGDPQQLIRQLMHGAAALFRADGVLVHTVGESERLDLDQLRIRSLDLEGLPADLDRQALEIKTSDRALDSVRESERGVEKVLRILADALGYSLRDCACVPMLDHEGDVIGALTLFNAEDADGRPAAFSEDTVDLAASLAGQAAVAIDNARLRQEFKALFDAMIEAFAVAVDEKSPYTGGHCRRVPDLAMMILEEIRTIDHGVFADVSFDDHETYEMRVAALLHDCGKVVTPVHVVDKATKLETIWDRIDLIDQRFETMARQYEADEFRRAAEDAGIDLEDARRRIDEAVGRMRREQEFLRRANVGAEFMDDGDIERVRAIRTTLSWRDAAGETHAVLDDREERNLSIRRGTLNDDERRIINYHIDATIKMLRKLPFPKRMRDVTRIAGSHHERLDGKGYPAGVAGDEIPLRGRILAVADVYEALTASDRPYKKSKSAAEALRILGLMARDGHLDPDVVEIFLERRVWERYGETADGTHVRDAIDVDAIRDIFRPAPAR